MSLLAYSAPLAFADGGIFLLFLLLVFGGLGFFLFSTVGGALRHRRMESGSETEMIEGDEDSPRQRPTHTRVTDPADVEEAGTGIQAREPRQGPSDH